uniref:Uncharacterized protein n=1 Tax=Dromaius novaehollandiae TaxID=8790 RepID=A0A8C4J382_DRONO
MDGEGDRGCSRASPADRRSPASRKSRTRGLGGGAPSTPASPPGLESPRLTLPPAVGGVWTPWTAWSECSAPCDAGVQTRNRSSGRCPGCWGAGGGPRAGLIPAVLPGAASGRWSAWTPWSECSASCGLGLQRRHRLCRPCILEPCARECREPVPGARGRRRGLWGCIAPGEAGARSVEAEGARPGAGPGGWGAWSPWSGCSRSCGQGVRSRGRACSSPAPQGHGDFCEGAPVQVEACNPQECPGEPPWGRAGVGHPGPAGRQPPVRPDPPLPPAAPDCAAVEGSAYSRCGPSCPRSCDDIAV